MGLESPEYPQDRVITWWYRELETMLAVCPTKAGRSFFLARAAAGLCSRLYSSFNRKQSVETIDD
jgi:hypothetical protein